MSGQDPYELYKRPTGEHAAEEVVEVRPPRRQLPLCSIRGIGTCAAFAVVAGLVGYQAGNGMNRRDQEPTVGAIEPLRVLVLESPPSLLRAPKKVGTVASSVEIICAHYAYELFPKADATPGFKATDYQVFDNTEGVSGFVLADEVKPAWTVPPCNDTVLFIKRLEQSIPDIRHATTPVPGEVVQ